MIFNAKYVSPNDASKEVYWRTIAADGVRDARQIADRYAKKGYVCVMVIEKMLTA